VNDWKVIPTIVLTTVLIFGAGVFTGGMLVDYVKQNHPRMALRQPNPPPPSPATNGPIIADGASTNLTPAKPVRPPEILGKDFLQRLDTDLHLTKDEHDAVQKIINDGQNQMRKTLQDARLEIREVLTPAQRDQFDEIMKRPFHKPIFPTNAPPATPFTPTNSP
jgi:uncharacterized membrane protein